MKAVVYHGAADVRVDDVPDPAVERPDDVVLRVTATAIGGSDLHAYRGRLPGVRPGDSLGREFMGIVEACGPAVATLRPGDRVVVPFVVACGHCFFCGRRLFAACETTRPQHAAGDGRGPPTPRRAVRPGAACFGMGQGIPGGQAEYVRVPHADVGPAKVPDALGDDEALFLSDILPTGWQAAISAGVGRGSSVAVLGAGPVGMMAAASARLLGADKLFVVDHHDDRLEYARAEHGAVAINFDRIDDPAALIIEETDGRGVDAVIDAVGFDAKGSVADSVLTNLGLEGSSGQALRQALAAVRRGGTVSVAGVYTGVIHGFGIGDAFDKGIAFRMGPTHVQHWLPVLLEHVAAGRLQPQRIVTHRLPLADAARGYELADAKLDDCRKVVLIPATQDG
jgi:threonine dehydrogenase-like Zn-dependent dehydrogenase